GELAVVTEEGSGHGAMLRVSRDGGQTFSRAITVFTGLEPGVLDPSCPFDSSVGARQRALMSPRVTFDRAGDLHVVAALGNRLQGSTNATDLPGVSGGLAVVGHALVRGGRVVARTAVTAPTTDQQWAPAIAPLPKGGVAVEWLQTAGPTRTSYDAWSAVLGAGASRFAPPQRLSDSASTFPAAMEAADNSNCYGVGDYIGLAPTPTGVAAVWPTTVGDVPGVDSDVILRLGVAA
ncbi:MAG TPA: hypothetical protein VKJ07_05650, partial [Mycobacteriales bacterium]|nr:hypothetical protein [Mycobacteriales bacterium]